MNGYPDFQGALAGVELIFVLTTHRQQMYKKRFAKWGLQKNSKRSIPSNSNSSLCKVNGQKRNASEVHSFIANSPQPSNDDHLRLAFFTSVRTWGSCFFESVQVPSRILPSARHSGGEQSLDINSTFKLSIEMLNRGQGVLAGRLARKGFLLIDEMLALEGPALVWNMLETIHDLVTSRNLRLMHLLLVHLNALVKTRMAANHPLRTILAALGAFASELLHSSSITDKTSTTSDNLRRLFNAADRGTVIRCENFSTAFLSIIEQAWTLNAEILFDRFDHRLFQLYVRVHWDSCSVKLSSAVVAAAKRWFARIISQQHSGDTKGACPAQKLIQITPFAEDRLLERIFTAPEVSSPPRSFGYLHKCSVAALQNSANYIFNKETNSANDTKILLRILAGLVTARTLGEWPANAVRCDSTDTMVSKFSRGHVEVVACALETSRDLHAMGHTPPTLWNTVGKIGPIMNLHEYAGAETDPRAIREMWLLADALVATGEDRKAWEIGQKAYRQLEKLVKDVPCNST